MEPNTGTQAKAGNSQADLERPRLRLWRAGRPPRGGVEGLAQNHRVVIDGSYPRDEPVGQRWGMVEPALWRRRHMVHPIAPRCVRATRWGRGVGDPGRPGIVRVEGMVEIVRHPQTKGRATGNANVGLKPPGGRGGYKRERSSNRCGARSRSRAYY